VQNLNSAPTLKCNHCDLNIPNLFLEATTEAIHLRLFLHNRKFPIDKHCL
jgi:hypothetical protein